MNILILSDLIAYSGVGQYMVQLSKELLNHKDIGTVVMASSNIQRTDIPKEIIVEKLETGHNFLSYIFSLRKIISRYNITVVHCNHRKQSFFMRLYQLIYGKITVVWTCHTVPYPNNFIKRLLGYYGHKSIAISSEAKIWMHDELKIDDRHLDVVLHGVDNSTLIISNKNKSQLKEDFFNENFHVKINGENTSIIIAHGRLHPVKGLDLLIKAFAELSIEERKNIKVVLSGDKNTPYFEYLNTLINKYKLEGYFYFAGWIKSVDIFNIADLMIQPSHREGFALAALEAFFMKVPVIRTKVGGYQDMKEYCIGIPVNSVEAIAKELMKWINSKDIYNMMVDKAYKYALEHGTIKAMTEKTIETYKKAIEICH